MPSACRIQMDNQDSVTGQTIVQKQREKYLVQNPPAKPLNRQGAGQGVRAALHPPLAPQLRRAWAACRPSKRWSSRSSRTGAAMAAAISAPSPCTRGDGSPAEARRAFWRRGERITRARISRDTSTTWAAPRPISACPAASEQMTKGMCQDGKSASRPAPALICWWTTPSISRMLRRAACPARSQEGVHPQRHPLRLSDAGTRTTTFFKELVEHHVSGQLKVAPEHCAPQHPDVYGQAPGGGVQPILCEVL